MTCYNLGVRNSRNGGFMQSTKLRLAIEDLLHEKHDQDFFDKAFVTPVIFRDGQFVIDDSYDPFDRFRLAEPQDLIHNFEQPVRFTDGKRFDTTDRDIANRKSNGTYFTYHGTYSLWPEDKNSPQ